MTTTLAVRPDSPAPSPYEYEQIPTLGPSNGREAPCQDGFNGAPRQKIRRLVLAVSIAFLAITASGCMDTYSTRAAVGSGAGGALGAYVGSEVSGQTGAVIGGGLGAAAGSILATETYPRPDERHRKS
ncbi:MAG: hypothetical protein WBM40_13320, partial [Thiohalocapsa sp.]